MNRKILKCELVLPKNSNTGAHCCHKPLPHGEECTFCGVCVYVCAVGLIKEGSEREREGGREGVFMAGLVHWRAAIPYQAPT